jgi:hypothetical protein
MTDDEWDLKRNRAILAAFQIGRPVFADSDGELRYVRLTPREVTGDR